MALHLRPAPSCSCQVAPTVAALCAYAAEIRDAEVARALSRLGNLSEREALVVQALAERIVGTFLHRPLTVLKADAEAATNMARGLRQLFQLNEEFHACAGDAAGAEVLRVDSAW